MAYFSYNLLGYIPGPAVYGVISKYTDPTSRIGMCVLVYALVVAFFLLWFACCTAHEMAEKVEAHELDKIVNEYESKAEESSADEPQRTTKERQSFAG